MADSNHTTGAAVAGVTIAFTVLACLVTGLRLYCRYAVIKSVGIDDYFITYAAACSVALTVAMCEQVKYGMGRHYDKLSDNEKRMAMIWICAYILMLVIASYSAGTMFASVFVCTPIRFFWDKSIIGGTCVNETAVWFVNTVLNIVTDIATTVLPLPVLRSLRLPKRQKILLMLVFGVGFTTCIISILRLHSLYIVSRTDDLSWDNPMPAIWSSTELNVAILCSCLPTLKGLISRVAPRLLGSSRAGGRSGSFGRSLGQDNRNTGDKSPMPHELHSASPGQSPFSPKKPTFLQTDSESEVFEPDQIRVRTDVDIRQGSYVQGLEPSHALTGKEGESLKYMRANPSYKV